MALPVLIQDIQNCIHNRYIKEQILVDAGRQVHSSNATASVAVDSFVYIQRIIAHANDFSGMFNILKSKTFIF